SLPRAALPLRYASSVTDLGVTGRQPRNASLHFVSRSRVMGRCRILALTVPATPTPRTSFASDSDEDLLFYMALQMEDPTTAEQAWEEFFSRHRAYLIGV